MSWRDVGGLILLGALWASSALCGKVAVPAWGEVLTAFCRTSIGCGCLVFICHKKDIPLNLTENWRRYLVLGVLNVAIPYWLFASAAHNLTASLIAVMNSLSPLWATVLGVIFRIQPMSLSVSLGLIIGMCGLSVLVGMDASSLEGIASMWHGVLKLTCATLSYGLAMTYVKKSRSAQPFADAAGSLCMGSVCLFLFLPQVHAVDIHWRWSSFFALLVLGFMGTGLCVLVFYTLLSRLKPSSVFSASFLIPIFGVFFGWLFLDEQVGWHTVVGVMITLLGTSMVMGVLSFNLKRFWKVRPSDGGTVIHQLPHQSIPLSPGGCCVVDDQEVNNSDTLFDDGSNEHSSSEEDEHTKEDPEKD